MEREKEIAKLVNVLRRTSRMALQSDWTGNLQPGQKREEVSAFCVDQYNRVLARVKEIDPDVGSIFDALAPGSSLTVAAMACRQLAAYYEDEVGRSGGWGDWKGVWADPRLGVWIDKSAFKDFWDKSAREIEDFGEHIRESIEDWVTQRKPPKGASEASSKTTSKIDPEDTKAQ